LATESELRKFNPPKGASGQVDVRFDHEKRGGSSPSEKRTGPKNTVAVNASDPTRGK
jgi:hypothetical protein